MAVLQLYGQVTNHPLNDPSGYRRLVMQTRREVLKKLAVGGGAAVGSPLIVSSIAFADSGTAKCQPANCPLAASYSVTTGGNGTSQNWMIITVTTPLAAVCGVGYSSSIEYRYRSSGASTSGGKTPVVRDSTRATLLAATGVWTTFQATNSVTITNNNVGNNLNNGNYTVDVFVRLVCTNGAVKCWCCKGRTQSGAWVTTFGGTQGNLAVSSTDCDIPAP